MKEVESSNAPISMRKSPGKNGKNMKKHEFQYEFPISSQQGNLSFRHHRHLGKMQPPFNISKNISQWDLGGPTSGKISHLGNSYPRHQNAISNAIIFLQPGLFPLDNCPEIPMAVPICIQWFLGPQCLQTSTCGPQLNR